MTKCIPFKPSFTQRKYKLGIFIPYSGILLLPQIATGEHDSLFTVPTASGELQLLIRKVLSMFSNKHILQTEEREHVDKELRRDRAEQIHIYLQFTDLFSKMNSRIYWDVLVTLDTVEMTLCLKSKASYRIVCLLHMAYFPVSCSLGTQ